MSEEYKNIDWDNEAEEVEPTGQARFYSWGARAGQTVVGKVLAFRPFTKNGYKGATCFELDVELFEETVSFDKDGDEKEKHEAGSAVRVKSPGSLEKQILDAVPAEGDLIRIELVGKTKTANGTRKDFKVQVKRNSPKGELPDAPKEETPEENNAPW